MESVSTMEAPVQPDREKHSVLMHWVPGLVLRLTVGWMRMHTRAPKHTSFCAVTGICGMEQQWLLLFTPDEHEINGNRRNVWVHQYSNSLPSFSISSIHVPGAFETFILNQSVSLSLSLIHSKIHFESWRRKKEQSGDRET